MDELFCGRPDHRPADRLTGAVTEATPSAAASLVPGDHKPRGVSRRRAAHPVDIGLATQDVEPMIEWGAEQGHHFGVEIIRGRIALPVVVVFYGVPNLQSGETV